MVHDNPRGISYQMTPCSREELNSMYVAVPYIVLNYKVCSHNYWYKVVDILRLDPPVCTYAYIYMYVLHA